MKIAEAENCGLVALKQMTQVKNISMFSLIHLAKDNGINLYFCQVDPADLVKVARPAILHQKNHFVYVEDGTPMPAGAYTGYVLTTRPFNEPLPHSLAKKIFGQSIFSSIGNAIGNAYNSAKSAVSRVASNVSRAAAPVVSRVASAARSVASNVGRSTANVVRGITAAIRPIVNSSRVAAAPSSSGYRYAGTPVQPSTAFGSRLAPSNVASGGFRAPGGNIIPGASTPLSFAGVNPGGFGSSVSNFVNGAASLASNVGTGIQNAVSSLSHGAAVPASMSPASSNYSLPGAHAGGFAAATSPRAASVTPGAAPTASMSPSRYSSAGQVAGGATPGAPDQTSQYRQDYGIQTPSTFYGTPGDWEHNQSMQTDPGNPFGFSQSMSPSAYSPGGGGNRGGGGGGGGGGGQDGGGDFTGAAPNDTMANYSQASQFLGYGGLPTATRDQLNKYAGMSLDDLTKEFTQQNDAGMRQLDEKYQQQKDELMTQYANYGQDPMTSSDAQNKLARLDRDYAQSKAEYQQQITSAAQDKAIQFKKEMLSQSMSQGQFDYKAAMDLAQNIGQDRQLQAALDSHNPELLQQVLVSIMGRK